MSRSGSQQRCSGASQRLLVGFRRTTSIFGGTLRDWSWTAQIKSTTSFRGTSAHLGSPPCLDIGGRRSNLHRSHTLVSTQVLSTTFLRRPRQAKAGDVPASRQTLGVRLSSDVGSVSSLSSSCRCLCGCVQQEQPNEATPDALAPHLRLIGMHCSSAGGSEGISGEERKQQHSRRPL